MRTEMPLVSVIIPTYNRSTVLRRAIQSVLGQTYRHVQCIVVDDASYDDTKSVVHQFADDRLIYICHKINRHASAARNTGIAHAAGNFIAFLDDDDEWLSNKLEKQVPLLLQAPGDVGLVYCWMDYYRDGTLIHQHHPTLRGYVFDKVLDRQRLGGCPTLLVRREVVEVVGGFDESLLRGNDGDFIRRVCHEYHVDYVPEVLVRVYADQGRRQISDDDEQGLRNAIRGHLTKVHKFGGEINLYPKEFAHIFSTIGRLQLEIGETCRGLLSFLRALRTYPVSSTVYLDFIRSIRHLLVAKLRRDYG